MTTLAFAPGQEIIAGEEAIGEIIDTLHHNGVEYLHVRRFGPGLDDLYIPSIAVRDVVAKHVYLTLDAASLLGEPWHIRPGASPY